jgi:uncharacterized membrane protein
LVVDKLPETPRRIEALGLLSRALSGGASAAVLTSRRKKVVPVALVGASAAIISAYAGYALRMRVRDRLGRDDTVVAFAEDAVTSGAGLLLSRAA